ncbi:MAG: hybrid sensor histidine kinase/response regulator [Massilia sp.]|nr:hybrid sensor histidine kinase/response regulator [Massilia sp.]
MPSDLCPLLAPDELPPPSPSDERHARDELELVSLRATVSRLLAEIQSRCELPPITETSNILSEQLRQANHHRALATFGNDPDTHGGEAAALRQTEFLSMLAHELRNPLQPMAMANDLLGTIAETNATVAQAHGVLSRQITHMVRLLDDLLDASRAASGKLVMQLAPIGLRDVIDAAVETSHPGMHRRHQKLQINLPEGGVTVTGDLIRLAQVFSNLLINASQFTDPGGSIVVSALCTGRTVEVTVSDDGAGIPVELQPFVFDLFTQGHRTLERLPSGVGVGLSLVRTIIQMHGGNSSVSSRGLGKGSAFTITLPLAPDHPAELGQVAEPATVARKIIIIEDNADANEIMAMLLQMEGYEVTSCFDGVSGLRTALDGHFDIVLCDLGLPGLSGFQVVAALKEARQARPPSVIATTGYSDAVQCDLARAAGFDHYLVKPLHLPTLYKVIAQYCP